MLRREVWWMEDGGWQWEWEMQHAICAMQLLRHYTYTYIFRWIYPRGGFFQMMQLQLGLGGDMASVRCGVGPVELRHQCSGQYGVVVPRIWV